MSDQLIGYELLGRLIGRMLAAGDNGGYPQYEPQYQDPYPVSGYELLGRERREDPGALARMRQHHIERVIERMGPYGRRGGPDFPAPPLPSRQPQIVQDRPERAVLQALALGTQTVPAAAVRTLQATAEDLFSMDRLFLDSPLVDDLGFFQVLQIVIGRNNQIVNVSNMPARMFANNSTLSILKGQTLQAGMKLSVQVQNNDAVSHDISGGVLGMSAI
jgi:hypothetical protein